MLAAAVACRSAAPDAPAALAGSAGRPAAGQQRLFRVQVERQGAPDPSFRLALRIEREDRFELAATDSFGRSLWRIEVEGARGRFRDERDRWACRFDPAEPSALPRLAWGLAALDLPTLLLGRLPAVSELEGAVPEPGPFDFADRRGRRWSGESDARGAVFWRMMGPSGSLAFRREPAGGALSEEPDGFAVRWRELAAEELSTPLPGLGNLVPDLPECGNADLS